MTVRSYNLTVLEFLLYLKLIVGDYGLSFDQQRVQMSMWAILAAPLFISADLKNMKPESRELLQNFWLLRINQDPYGVQGRRIVKVIRTSYLLNRVMLEMECKNGCQKSV